MFIFFRDERSSSNSLSSPQRLRTNHSEEKLSRCVNLVQGVVGGMKQFSFILFFDVYF